MKQKKFNNSQSKWNLTIRDITIIGLMVAVIEVCKIALGVIPNVELTTFWLIIFTMYLGKKIFFVVPVFILIEGFIYGIHLWWLMYLYVWPLLVLITWIFRKNEDVWFWSFLSGGFGLFFGLLCSLVYVLIGWTDGGFMNGLQVAFAWWITGIPWDVIHGVANFVLMLVLYRPMKRIMGKLSL